MQYTELQQQAVDMDAMELDTTRHTIRPNKDHKMPHRLQTAYGKKFDPRTLAWSRKDEDVGRTSRTCIYPSEASSNIQTARGKKPRQKSQAGILI